MVPEVIQHPVIVQQGIVYVKQEHDFRFPMHGGQYPFQTETSRGVEFAPEFPDGH
jgi:hypothetical protein